MRDWFRHHARITMAEVLPGFTPPSASMNPDATVMPWSEMGGPPIFDGPPTRCKADGGQSAIRDSTARKQAQIKQVGRWRYEICLILRGDGWITMERGPWFRWGRQRAEAKARRELARYRAEQKRETWTIR